MLGYTLTQAIHAHAHRELRRNNLYFRNNLVKFELSKQNYYYLVLDSVIRLLPTIEDIASTLKMWKMVTVWYRSYCKPHSDINSNKKKLTHPKAVLLYICLVGAHMWTVVLRLYIVVLRQLCTFSIYETMVPPSYWNS